MFTCVWNASYGIKWKVITEDLKMTSFLNSFDAI